jgi:hypothetical protein
MCNCDAHCGMRRFYQCGPFVNGRMFIQITLRPYGLLWTVFHYLLSKCLCYYITITSLPDACVICSIHQLIPCVVCRKLFACCSVHSHTRSLNARRHIRKQIEGPSSLMPPSDVQFVGSERYIQGSHSGSTGSRRSNDPKASFLVDYGSFESIDNLQQAGPSLVILNDTQSLERLAADKKDVISTSLTA